LLYFSPREGGGKEEKEKKASFLRHSLLIFSFHLLPALLGEKGKKKGKGEEDQKRKTCVEREKEGKKERGEDSESSEGGKKEVAEWPVFGVLSASSAGRSRGRGRRRKEVRGKEGTEYGLNQVLCALRKGGEGRDRGGEKGGLQPF